MSDDLMTPPTEAEIAQAIDGRGGAISGIIRRLAFQRDMLVARVEASQLVWSGAKPTREGWYWWRAHVDAPRDDWSLVDVWERQTGRDKGKLVTRNFGFGCVLSEWHGQFAGPIPPPTDTITPSAAPSPAAEG